MADSSRQDQSIVLVPVPREFLSAVYELLAKSMNAGDNQHMVSSIQAMSAELEETACLRCRCTAYRVGDFGFQCSYCGLAFRDDRAGIRVDEANGLWTPAMINGLRQEIHLKKLLMSVMDFIAKSAPRTVSSDELILVTGADASQLRAEMAALSKATRRVFGKRIWPVSAKQGWGNGDRMGYKMEAQIADWWLADR